MRIFFVTQTGFQNHERKSINLLLHLQTTSLSIPAVWFSKSFLKKSAVHFHPLTFRGSLFSLTQLRSSRSTTILVFLSILAAGLLHEDTPPIAVFLLPVRQRWQRSSRMGGPKYHGWVALLWSFTLLQTSFMGLLEAAVCLGWKGW